MSHESADENLVVEIARGSTRALAQLYERHAPVMLGLARRILGDEREAEDLLHDVFVEVWKLAGDFDPARGSVRGWLYLRLRSRAIDRKRSARERTIVLTADASDAPDTARQARLIDFRRAADTFDELPADKRRVLELGYFEGLSASEIARELDIPIGTVKSRMASALADLRRRLGVQEPRGAEI